MSACHNKHSRRGFTLVEVLAAVGAFTIAFLAGFAAIGTFMLRQDHNFQRTQAAAAAMFLSEWHANWVTRPSATAAASGARPRFGDSDTPVPTAGFTASGSILKMIWKKDPALTSNYKYITFRGGDGNSGPNVAKTDDLFIFNSGKIDDSQGIPDNAIYMDELQYGFKDLIVSVSSSSSETVGSYTFPVRQLTFWYGSPNDVSAASSSNKTTVEFLGRYMIMEPILP